MITEKVFVFSHNITWVKKDDEFNADVFWNIKLEVDQLGENGVEAVSKLCGAKQGQGEQVELLTIGKRRLVLQ